MNTEMLQALKRVENCGGTLPFHRDGFLDPFIRSTALPVAEYLARRGGYRAKLNVESIGLYIDNQDVVSCLMDVMPSYHYFISSNQAYRKVPYGNWAVMDQICSKRAYTNFTWRGANPTKAFVYAHGVGAGTIDELISIDSDIRGIQQLSTLDYHYSPWEADYDRVQQLHTLELLTSWMKKMCTEQRDTGNYDERELKLCLYLDLEIQRLTRQSMVLSTKSLMYDYLTGASDLIPRVTVDIDRVLLRWEFHYELVPATDIIFAQYALPEDLLTTMRTNRYFLTTADPYYIKDRLWDARNPKNLIKEISEYGGSVTGVGTVWDTGQREWRRVNQDQDNIVPEVHGDNGA